MSDDSSRCPCCGQLNQCAQAGADAPVSDCWCFSVPIDAAQLAKLPPEQRNRSCLCPRCAQGLPPEAQPAAD
ncbi:cysteine-rich CWC family protein [Pseudomonas sp. EA_35y_Pfl2_R5]|uniref:cysteine-rich CWC family protein n=1 Tax=Pseudomonas sp. EA_35y_Pfl2_R5 TaxID=3088690 RepID=UPI0030D9CFD5